MAKIDNTLPQTSPEVLEVLNNAPKTWIKRTIIIVFVAGLLIWSASALNMDYLFELIKKVINGEDTSAITTVWNIILFFFNPNRNPLKEVLHTYFLTFESQGVPYLMYETVMIAFVGTLLGAVISIPFAFLSSRNITGIVGSFLGSTVITMIRTLPIFVWGIIFIKVEGGAFAGVLAISVSSIGMISKLYIEAIEDIDKGILEALDSTGATIFQKIRYGIIPQLTANFISTAIYRFEINVKNATILGMVGAGGIGFTLIDALGSANFGLVAVCMWGIIPVVFLIEYISTRLRTYLTTGE